ncbi:putative membrane protein [Bordetella holmesii 1058]|uniref:Membrane protein n=1 Tax=Bordetella holmesii 1058 TaxID=1247648 RepID=A0ABN0S4V6_9BORD|nr:putative membrane protein [Bordetella holmesii 1058]
MHGAQRGQALILGILILGLLLGAWIAAHWTARMPALAVKIQ